MNFQDFTYLILEEDTADQLRMRQFLLNAGIPESSLHCANSLAQIPDHRYDFVLTVLNFKESFGLQMLSSIREIFSDSAHIVISETEEFQIVEEVIKIGVEEYIFKKDLTESHIKKSIRIAKERFDLKNRHFNNESRYSGIIENNNDASLIIDEEFNIQYATKSVERLTGFTCSEILRKNVTDYLHPENANRVEFLTTRLLHSNESQITFKERIKNKNNGYKWMEAIVTDQRNVSGVNGLVVNFRDIDKEERTKEELTKMNQRFKIAAAATSDAIWDWDLDTNELYFGEGYSRLFGYAVNDNKGHFYQRIQLIHPEDRDRVLDSLQFAIHSKADRWEEEYRFKKDDGEYAYVIDRGMVVKDEQGNSRRIVGAMQDITERKIREEDKEIYSRLSRMISKAHTMNEGIDQSLEFLSEFTGYPLIEAWLPSIDRNEMHLAGRKGATQNAMKFIKQTKGISYFEKGVGLPGIICQDHKPKILNNLGSKEEFIRNKEAEENGLNAVIGLPLVYNEKLVGVLLFFSTEKTITGVRSAEFDSRLSRHLGSEILQKMQEEELNRFFDLSPDLLCIAGTDGYFKKINKAATKLYGWSEEELLSTPFLSYSHPDDVKKIKNIIDKMEAGEDPDTYLEVRIINKWGQEKWLAWTSNLQPDSGLMYAVGKDITNQKQQAAELNRLKNIQKYVINSTSDLIWAIDTEHKLLLGNEAYFEEMKKVTGGTYKLGEKVLSSTAANWDFDENRKTFWQQKYNEALDGNSQSFLFEVESMDISARTYQVELEPISYQTENGKEEISGVACFSKDITEGMHHIKAIEEQNEKLRDIAWMQSHLVRAPLARIMGLVNVLNRGRSNEEEEKFALKNIIKSAIELDEVITEMVGKAEKMNKELKISG